MKLGRTRTGGVPHGSEPTELVEVTITLASAAGTLTWEFSTTPAFTHLRLESSDDGLTGWAQQEFWPITDANFDAGGYDGVFVRVSGAVSPTYAPTGPPSNVIAISV